MRQRFPLFNVVLSILFLFACSKGFATDIDTNTTLTGILTVNWGDPPPGSGMDEPPPAYSITDKQHHTTPLEITDDVLHAAGGILMLNGKPVSVTVADDQPLPFTRDLQRLGAPFQVTAVRLLTPKAAAEALPSPPPVATPAIAGQQSWISIMCKFADEASEPQSLAYFRDMYSSTYPGLDHYWREVSYNTINMAGSEAAGWYDLPHNRSYYVKDNSGNGEDDFFDRLQAAIDCTAAADADVNFADYQGINLMFNAELDNFAWGGTQSLSLDGDTKNWPLTWLPPWGYENLAAISHEMGHAFGLPHSSGNYGQVYDNVWDIMSSYWEYCSLTTHPTFNCLGQHTIAYHKDTLNWIPAEQKFIAPLNAFSTVTLERLAEPQTDQYRMIQIPIPGVTNRFYTVEARRLTGYDEKLPGSAVIIHEVNPGRKRPAHIIDRDGDGDTGDEGAMMTVGDQYNATDNGISVTVDEETITGFIVTVGIFTPPQIISIHSINEKGDTLLSEGRQSAEKPTGLRVSFDQNVVDALGDTELNDVTNPTNYLLYQAGPDQIVETLDCAGIAGDDIEIALDSVEYDDTTFQATLALDSTFTMSLGFYGLNVCGTTSIENINGDKLDGDGDGGGGDDYHLAFEVIPSDSDLDGVPDGEDNCPLVANPNQMDLDGDSQGNACDADDDNDSIPDTEDNCRLTPNIDQRDFDNNGTGDACETDADSDGIADDLDNCPFTANPDQTDSDGNGTGNACETDADGDGIADNLDNCPFTPNPDQADSDSNGLGNACTQAEKGLTFPVRMQKGTFILIRL